MFNAEYEQEVAIIARRLWAEGTRVLHWSNEPTSKEAPWAEAWADVYVRELCEPLETNWLATIVSPTDEDHEEGWGYFKVPHDAELVFEFTSGLAATRKTFLRPGHKPIEIAVEEDNEEDDSGASEFYWSMYRQERYHDPGCEVPTYRVPVWSAEVIACRIEDWLEEISGYRFQLRLSESAQSPMNAQVREAVEEISSGQGERFDLGDGVFATGAAFDALLADPDMAADVVARIKRMNSGREE